MALEKHKEIWPNIDSSTDSSINEGNTVFTSRSTFQRSPEEARLVRKINLAFLPLVSTILFVQFMDKSTLSFSGVMGIFEDTGISHNEFSWLGSMFYVGYLAMQIPNQYFLQRVQISKYLGAVLMVWGVCLALTAFSKNFSHLAGLRFLLGFWEGTVYASVFLLISTLYRRSEQVTLFGAMFICTSCASCLGGLVGYAIGSTMDGLHDMRAWKWSMILWGIITFFLGSLFLVFLPDKPTSRWFRLTPEEKKIVEERTQDNAVVCNQDIRLTHILEALKEPQLYCYFLISLLLNLSNGALSLFNTQITNAMGFSRLHSILLQMPAGAITILVIGCAVYFSRKLDEICYVAALCTLLSMSGAILLVTIPAGPAQLAGLYLTPTASAYVMLQTSISSNVSGYTKKIFYTSCNIVAYCIGNFIGPLVMVEEDGPRYVRALATYALAELASGLLFLYIRWIYVQENKRRQKAREQHCQVYPAFDIDRQKQDLTDKQDLYFVYRP
ncbi:major facilitator superfamily domain-containing protein [Dichotomocladium elegans]|nr:major facilitator superfamily domain-containing protein [Dichotomocladium elegans]